ncbi:MAG: Rrf2 family transcriptional regulator [Firmicutes bacterium]|nr:Rrf2 family transcriptional regulator [Bacillota bacterium]
MQLSSRFPVAVQMLIILAWCPEELKVTSEMMALSVNTNPALIRRIMGYLKRAGLIAVTPGAGGTRLTRDPAGITLLEIYRAVELTGREGLFGLHEEQNLRCPIGIRINRILRPHLAEAQEALERSLAGVTVAKLLEGVPPFGQAISAEQVL